MRASRCWPWVGMFALGPALLATAGASEASGTERVLERFELIRQPDPTSCGPTCVAMVLRHYSGDEAAVWAELPRPGRRVAWMSPRGLARLLSRRGVAATVRRGELPDLMAAIDGGRPPIVLVRLGPMMWHYVVVTGYRRGGAEFRLADPHGRHSWIGAAVLAGTWRFDGDLEGRPIVPPPCATCGGRPSEPACGRCRGSGRSPDAARLALEGLGLAPHLLIVPDRPPAG